MTKRLDYFSDFLYNIYIILLLTGRTNHMDTNVNVITVIEKVIQLLVILLIGIYTRKKGFIGRDTVKSLSQFLSHVTNPLLIICSFQTAYSPALLHAGLFILIGSFFIHLFSCILAYFFFKPKKGSCENAVYEFNTIFANCAFMGFPILMAIYGDTDGVIYGSFYNTFFHFFFWTYGIIILTRHKERAPGEKRFNLKKLLLNPGVLATAIGFVLFLTGAKIPGAVLGGMKMVGDATFPLAMIIIGALIVELDWKTAFRDLKFYLCAFLKLLLIPAVVLLCCILVHAPDVVTYVLVILSGMPSATFGAIFAELYGTNPVTSAKVVCLSTILSIATIPLLIYVTGLVL